MKKKVTLTSILDEVKNLGKRMDLGFTETEEKLSKKFDEGIEGLAVMAQNQFSEINTRFDKVEERLDRIENVTLLSHTQQIEKLRDNYLVLKKKVDTKY